MGEPNINEQFCKSTKHFISIRTSSIGVALCVGFLRKLCVEINKKSFLFVMNTISFLCVQNADGSHSDDWIESGREKLLRYWFFLPAQWTCHSVVSSHLEFSPILAPASPTITVTHVPSPITSINILAHYKSHSICDNIQWLQKGISTFGRGFIIWVFSESIGKASPDKIAQ